MSEQKMPFTPIAPNPFLTGAPVRNPKMFFGRDDDFEYVRQRLVAEQEGIVLMLVGARRSGKTSIMFQILNGKLGDQFLPVFVDMQLMAGVIGDREFLGRTANIILESVEDERLVADYYDFSEGNPILIFDQLLEDVRQVFPGRRLIFLLDEAEILQSKVEKGELSGAILSYMASILESRQVSFCFTGSFGLNETNSEEWRRLTGKGDSREISFLSPGDTRSLIQRPVEGRVLYAEGIVDAIYRLTYGHPYYTQLICSYAVDHLNHTEQYELTHDDLSEVVRVLIDNPPPQLVYQWDDLTLTDRLTLAIIGEECVNHDTKVSAESIHQAIRSNKYPADHLRTENIRIALENLSRSKWLEREQDGTYSFRIDLFRQWVRHTRSIWSLVDETDAHPQRKKRGTLAFAATYVLAVVAVVAWFWLKADDERGQETLALSAPREGQVWIDAAPRDVNLELWVNGKRETRSLPTLFFFPPGHHAIELRHALYQTYSATLDITTSSQDTLTPTLKRRMGFLTLSTQPQRAHVRLRGGDVDTMLTAPVKSLALPTGTYEISTQAAGYVPLKNSVSVLDDDEVVRQLNLQANVGHLYVRSTPTNAQIVLNGKVQPQRTPTMLRDIPVGQHVLQLTLDQYLPQNSPVRVQLGEIDTAYYDLTIRPAHITLTSEPKGAQILLDNKPWRTAPIDELLPPGNYDLRIVYEGYQPEMTQVKLEPGENFVRNYTLIQYMGTIRIHDYFGQVDILDALTNRLVQSVQKPRDVILPVGLYLLRGGHKGALVEVQKDKRIIVKLTDQGIVRIQHYTGSVDILDNNSQRIIRQVQSPTDINLPVGQYTLRGGGRETTITVGQNQTQDVSLSQ